MMRPVLLALPPIAPDSLVFDTATGTLTFNDNSITETSFLVQKSLDGTTWTDVPDPSGILNSPLDQPNVHGPRSLVDPSFRSARHDLVPGRGPQHGRRYRRPPRGRVCGHDRAVHLADAARWCADAHHDDAYQRRQPVDLRPERDLHGHGRVRHGYPRPARCSSASTAPTSEHQSRSTPPAWRRMPTSTLAIGSHLVLAIYSGSTFYDTSLGTLTQVVNQAPSTTALTSSLNPSFFGQSVTFTATVAPAAATGTVVFNIDGVDVGAPVALVAGTATYTTTSLAAGDHPVIATYSGDTTYLTSSATLTQTVSPLIASTTSLSGSPNPSVYGQSVTFTATVSPVAATGTVVFSIDGTAGVPVNLNASGVATFATAALTAGNHSVVATYSGSATYATSASSTLTQVVNKATTTTTVRSSDTNGRLGDIVRLTATTTVVAPGAGRATGTVEFKLSNGTTTIILGANPIGAIGVTVFNWTVSAPQIGTWTLTATYSGDANFATSLGTLNNQRAR